MAKEFTYSDYTDNQNAIKKYNAYQNKYTQKIRESDKTLIELVQKYQKENSTLSAPKLLDIGCSTGNLLLHLKRLLPDLELEGGDLALSSIEKARENPLLEGIEFNEMNLFDLPENKYDIIIANAVAVYFKWPEYQKALQSIYKSLKPGGVYFAFEWLHPFSCQDIIINETTEFYPEGIQICFRPIPKVESKLVAAGFSSFNFIPFQMPFDLEEPAHDEEVISYTKKLENGGRITFRGALAQPWCHMIARKST